MAKSDDEVNNRDAVTSKANGKKPHEVKDEPKENKLTTKRKEHPTAPAEPTRKSTRGASRPQPSQTQLLKYMLTKEAEDLCRPDDETKDLESRKDGEVVTYTSGVFTPFQELLSAVILSRPISHTLGLRTIRTLFNPPYELTTATKIKKAGSEKIHQAMWDARTQHKDKTADQIVLLADVVLEKYASKDDEQGEHLGPVLSKDDVEESLADLMSHIKGFGVTGKQIFRRRVQWLYKAAYPFVDSKSSKALQETSLPDKAEDLVQAIDENWTELDSGSIAGKDEDEKKRRALVVLLERATAANLEGKSHSLLQKASET